MEQVHRVIYGDTKSESKDEANKNMAGSQEPMDETSPRYSERIPGAFLSASDTESIEYPQEGEEVGGRGGAGGGGRVRKGSSPGELYRKPVVDQGYELASKQEQDSLGYGSGTKDTMTSSTETPQTTNMGQFSGTGAKEAKKLGNEGIDKSNMNPLAKAAAHHELNQLNSEQDVKKLANQGVNQLSIDPNAKKAAHEGIDKLGSGNTVSMGNTGSMGSMGNTGNMGSGIGSTAGNMGSTTGSNMGSTGSTTGNMVSTGNMGNVGSTGSMGPNMGGTSGGGMSSQQASNLANKGIDKLDVDSQTKDIAHEGINKLDAADATPEFGGLGQQQAWSGADSGNAFKSSNKGDRLTSDQPQQWNDTGIKPNIDQEKQDFWKSSGLESRGGSGGPSAGGTGPGTIPGTQANADWQQQASGQQVHETLPVTGGGISGNIPGTRINTDGQPQLSGEREMTQTIPGTQADAEWQQRASGQQVRDTLPVTGGDISGDIPGTRVNTEAQGQTMQASYHDADKTSPYRSTDVNPASLQNKNKVTAPHGASTYAQGADAPHGLPVVAAPPPTMSIPKSGGTKVGAGDAYGTSDEGIRSADHQARLYPANVSSTTPADPQEIVTPGEHYSESEARDMKKAGTKGVVETPAATAAGGSAALNSHESQQAQTMQYSQPSGHPHGQQQATKGQATPSSWSHKFHNFIPSSHKDSNTYSPAVTYPTTGTNPIYMTTGDNQYRVSNQQPGTFLAEDAPPSDRRYSPRSSPSLGKQQQRLGNPYTTGIPTSGMDDSEPTGPGHRIAQPVPEPAGLMNPSGGYTDRNPAAVGPHFSSDTAPGTVYRPADYQPQSQGGQRHVQTQAPQTQQSQHPVQHQRKASGDSVESHERRKSVMDAFRGIFTTKSREEDTSYTSSTSGGGAGSADHQNRRASGTSAISEEDPNATEAEKQRKIKRKLDLPTTPFGRRMSDVVPRKPKDNIIFDPVSGKNVATNETQDPDKAVDVVQGDLPDSVRRTLSKPSQFFIRQQEEEAQRWREQAEAEERARQEAELARKPPQQRRRSFIDMFRHRTTMPKISG